MSAGHSMHIFINGQRAAPIYTFIYLFISAGTVYGGLDNPKLTYKGKAKLWAGSNQISILSVAVGLPFLFSDFFQNVGSHFETWNAGVLGPVTLDGLNEGRRDLTSQKWTYQVGLKGESLNLHMLSGVSSVEWGGASSKQPLTWYKVSTAECRHTCKAFFNAPSSHEPLALDMSSMGKGQIWINGQSIGRYWPAYKAYGTCASCDYRGTYNEKKCQTNCGESSQKWAVGKGAAAAERRWAVEAHRWLCGAILLGQSQQNRGRTRGNRVMVTLFRSTVCRQEAAAPWSIRERCVCRSVYKARDHWYQCAKALARLETGEAAGISLEIYYGERKDTKFTATLSALAGRSVLILLVPSVAKADVAIVDGLESTIKSARDRKRWKLAAV
ncbi:hypothetical protein GW17_00029992 [Ensete ventricosum]|nr:hypothetical protein GW17_00029992 [Ensete ventricosum]